MKYCEIDWSIIFNAVTGVITAIIGCLSYHSAKKSAAAAQSASDVSAQMLKIETEREKRNEIILEVWIDLLTFDNLHFSIVNLSDRPALIRNLEVKESGYDISIEDIEFPNRQVWNFLIPQRSLKTFKTNGNLQAGTNFELLVYGFGEATPIRLYIDSSKTGPHRIEIKA